MSTISPTEQDLHAYLDGELPPERVAAVEEYLGHNPPEAQRLKAYRSDGEAIAKLFIRADQIVSRAAFFPGYFNPDACCPASHFSGRQILESLVSESLAGGGCRNPFRFRSELGFAPARQFRRKRP